MTITEQSPMLNTTPHPADTSHSVRDSYSPDSTKGPHPTNGPHPVFGVVTVGCLLFAAAGIMYLVKSVTQTK